MLVNLQRGLVLLFLLVLAAVDYSAADELHEVRAQAAQGNAAAQFELGVRYETAWGVPQDYAAAVRWYRKAAEQGDAHAQNSLGRMYEEGTGVPQDDVHAYKWVELAVVQLTGPARTQVEKHRAKVAAKITPAQLAEAQRLAREWKPTPPQPG